MTDAVTFEAGGQVAIVTYERPDRPDAWIREMGMGPHRRMEEATATPGARVVEGFASGREKRAAWFEGT